TLPCQVPDIGVDTVNINGKTLDFIDEGIRFTGPSNLTGLPAVTVPAGISNGMPVGLQIIGPAFEEARILNVAYAVESMKPLAGHQPVLKP
ncbi:amidase family protein, partial [Alcaligenes phenolicus]